MKEDLNSITGKATSKSLSESACIPNRRGFSRLIAGMAKSRRLLLGSSFPHDGCSTHSACPLIYLAPAGYKYASIKRSPVGRRAAVWSWKKRALLNPAQLCKSQACISVPCVQSHWGMLLWSCSSMKPANHSVAQRHGRQGLNHVSLPVQEF